MSDGTSDDGDFDDPEPSDLFSVQKYASGPSIPLLDKLPLTREEIRRRRTLRVMWAVTGVVVAGLSVWLVLWWSHRSAVHDAVERASDDGRVASVREALELLEDDEDDVSRATMLRLRAMLVLSGEDEDADAIGAALTNLQGDDDRVARERGIAQTYLALACGDLQEAMDRASQIVATHGDHKAESLRARALAAWAVGNIDIASMAAQHAVTERPEAPRHVALAAELAARGGEADAALATLDGVPAEAQNAATRIARARIMDRAGADLDAVAAEAQAVLDDDTATGHEKAWARLLLARAAAASGDRITTRSHLDQAFEVAPPGDELFTLTLTEAALRMGADSFARQIAERLPSPHSTDAGRRAQLSAELALASRDLRAADSALAHAPAGARTSLARARLLEARGRFDEARTFYLQAADEPAHRVPAMVRLASMELAQDRAREAVTRVEPLLSEYPNHPDVVPVAVAAQLGLGRPQQAMELVDPALVEHPEDVRLLAAKAHVQAALEQWEAALATLDSALRIEGDDADLHADRGAAAQHLSRFEVAGEAYAAALALDASHPVALVGQLELDVNERRVPEARRILERADASELRSLRIERLRARLLVLEIAGHSGVRAVRRALETHEHDRVLVRSLGWLYMQAEEYTQAVRRFAHLLNDDEDSTEAILGRVLAQARMRASNPARAAMENLVEDLDEESLSPAVRAELHAVQARLAWADHNRIETTRQTRAAIEHDRHNSEAHLVSAEMLADRDHDATAEYAASLEGIHPSSRALALLSIREEQVSDATCAFARRYRRAAPDGQYARGIWRVLRDCRHRDEGSDEGP